MSGVITSGEQVAVVVIRADGSVRLMQPYSEYCYGESSLEILKVARGSQLLDLLTTDLAIVKIDDYSQLKISYCFADDPERRTGEVRILLGRLAEALIVKQCNQDVEMNRKWAKLAYRYEVGGVPNVDNYCAVGTGLVSTKNRYPTKYNPSDTQRDIIWVNKNDFLEELRRNSSSTSAGGYLAGLQVKVSKNLNYLYRQLTSKFYEVPVVYFDLNRDFEKLSEKLRRDPNAFGGRQSWKIGVNLICGRSISQEIHDTLEGFYQLLNAVLEGNLSLSDLVREDPSIGLAVAARSIEQPELYRSEYELGQAADCSQRVLQVATVPVSNSY